MADAWYECWFNTPYYHLLYGKRNEEEAAFFLNNLLNILSLPPGARCWDLNCGKGRHAMYLNKKGYNVIATDLSEESIGCAKTSENDTLKFFTHDMRNLFYSNYFDTVLNLFTSFGYFKHSYEDEKVFKTVANALKPGGHFVLDFFNASTILKNLKPLDEKEVNGVHFTIRKKEENGSIIKKISILDKGKKLEYLEEVKALSLNDFKRLAGISGLTLTSYYGDYALNQFNPDVSERLILIFTK